MQAPVASATEPENTAVAAPPDYFAWTRAIGEFYFRPEFHGKSVRLAIDETVLLQIGRSISASPESFVAAVSEVIKPDQRDPFGGAANFNLTQPHFPYLGILAAQVLIAARMGLSPSIDKMNFWNPFQDTFACGVNLKNETRQELDRLWCRARNFYSERNLGVLAVQADPATIPYRGWVHVNYPLWQVLLREADRAQLRSWIQAHPDVAHLRSHQLLEVLQSDIAAFNGNLRRRLHEARSDQPLADAIASLLDEVRSTATVLTEPRGASRSRGRLRLVDSPARCYLQRLLERGWRDVGAEVGADAVVRGFRDSETGVSWRGDPCIAFINAGLDGYVYTRGEVTAGSHVVLLFASPRVEKKIDAAHWKPFPLDASLAELRAVQGTARVSQDADLLAEFDCTCGRVNSVALEGGLHVGRSYISTALPRVRARSDAPCAYLDGKPIAVIDGFAQLPSHLAEGSHEIRIAGDVETFTIVDASCIEDSEGDEIGIGLSKSGIMRTVRTDNVRAETDVTHVLVGAQLWEV